MLSAIFLFFLVLISAGLGHKVIKLFRITFDTLLEKFVFSIGLGLGIVSYLTFLLAVTGLLYKWICFLLLVVLLLIALWGVWRTKNISSIIKQNLKIHQLKKLSFFEYGLLIVLSIYILLCFLSAIAPPIDWDSLVYHLAIPKLWVQNHKAIHIPYIFQSEYHLATENLYALGMVLAKDTTACLIIWMSSLLLILAVFSFCRQYISAKVGLLAVAALYCTPLISAISSRPMIDIPVTYYAFLGFYAFFKYLNSNDHKMLLLAGIMSGFAGACKHLGSIPFIILSVWVIIVEMRRRKSIIISFKYIVLFGLVFLIILTPWFIKCYVYTGKIINTWVPNVLILQGEQELKATFGFSQILNYITKFFRFLLIDIPFERSISGTLWSVGIFMLAFVPCLALLKNVDKIIKYMLMYSISGALLFTLIMPENYRQARFLAPVLPCLFISGAYTAYRLMNDYKTLTKYIQIIIILSIFFNVIPIAKRVYEGLPVVFGMETKEHYIDSKIYIYSAVEYVNKNLNDNDRVLNMDLRGYYFDKPYATIVTIEDVIGNMPRLIERLKAEGITHLLCNERYSNTGYQPLPEELKSYIKLVYKKNNVYLYKFDFSNGSPD